MCSPEKGFTFNSTNYANELTENLYRQKQNNQNCDLILNINNTDNIYAHLNIINVYTSYFSELVEKRPKSDQYKFKIVYKSLDTNIPKYFNEIVDFLYLGKLKICEDNISDILHIAKHFLIEKIVTYCIEFIIKMLNVDNWLRFQHLNNLYNLNLFDTLLSFKRKNFKSMISTTEILNFTKQQFYSFLYEKEICNLQALDALEMIIIWISHETETRHTHFDYFIKPLNWNGCDSVEIFTHLNECELYKQCPIVLYQILKRLNDQNVYIPTFQNKYQELHDQFAGQMTEPSTEDGEPTEKNENLLEDIHVEEIPSIISSKPKRKPKRIIKKLTLYRTGKPTLRLAIIKSKSKNRTLKMYKPSHDLTESSNGIKCPICSKTIDESHNLEQHLSAEHAKDITYRCGICSFTCQWNNEYISHMKDVHFPGPTFRCDSCEEEYESISELLTHRVQHIESVFQCSYCTFKCRQRVNFIAHTRVHNPPNRVKCDFCDQSFKNKELLETHQIQSHITEEMTEPSHVDNSMQHKCNHPHCTYSTSKKTQLINHMKIHSGVRPHSCNICGRGFMEKSHLVRHERIHLDEKPFKCGHCDYASSRRDKLKEHYTRHHGETASAKVPYKARPMKNSQSSNHQRSKQQLHHQDTNASAMNYTANVPTSTSNVSHNVTPNTSSNSNNDIQELMTLSTPSNISSITNNTNNIPPAPPNYHHFPDANTDFHHDTSTVSHNPMIPTSTPTSVSSTSVHQHPTHHLHNPQLHSHHHNNHLSPIRAPTNTIHPHSTPSSTAAAVAAAMMLDPRFHHHNAAVPYHPNNTPVSMAMVAVQSSQQHAMQNTISHNGEYPPPPPHMTLF